MIKTINLSGGLRFCVCICVCLAMDYVCPLSRDIGSSRQWPRCCPRKCKSTSDDHDWIFSEAFEIFVCMSLCLQQFVT